MRIEVDGVALDVPDDATDDEINEVYAQHLAEVGAANTAAMGRDTIGPTRRRIAPEEPGMSFIRSFGGGVPFTDYGGGAGNWLQDRYPEFLGGAPAGQERTWDEALADYRADRSASERRDPLPAVAGTALISSKLPWTRGGGATQILSRALENMSLYGMTELSRGEPLSRVLPKMTGAGGLSVGGEAAIAVPRLVRSLSQPVGRLANKEGAAALGLKSEKDVAAAAAHTEGSLKGLEGEQTIGQFAKEARLPGGPRLLEPKDTPVEVARKAAVLKEAMGARKGAVVSQAERQGVVVDPDTVIARMEQELKRFDEPSFRGAYGDAPYNRLAERINRVRAHMGLPPLIPPQNRIAGWGQVGGGAMPPTGTTVHPPINNAQGQPVSAVSPINPRDPGVSNANAAGLIAPDVPHRIPLREGAMPGNEVPATPSMIAASEEGLNTTGAPIASYTRTGPSPTPPPPRLIPGTMRPAPGSGWSVWFHPQPPRIPKTLAEWEKLKTNFQNILYDTRGKHGTLSADITGEEQEALERLQAIVREADEDAIRTQAANLYDEFMAAKRGFGLSSTAEELARSRALSSQISTNPQAAASHADWATRRAVTNVLAGAMGAGAGGAMGSAFGPVGFGLGAAAGYGVGRGTAGALQAKPAMTRRLDSLSQWLGRSPDTTAEGEAYAKAVNALLRAGSTP